ncbi:MAG: four helix bundle protein [Bacteroidota bacterium]|jgi:four helix bundle protein
MSTFTKFQEIEAWQKARELVRRIYDVTGQGQFAKDFALRDQIRRAAVSIMSNIAEGFGRGGTKEFIQFLSVAKGSVSEVESQLCVALDQKYIDQVVFEQLSTLADETGKMIAGLMRYLRQAKIKGAKYKWTQN